MAEWMGPYAKGELLIKFSFINSKLSNKYIEYILVGVSTFNDAGSQPFSKWPQIRKFQMPAVRNM